MGSPGTKSGTSRRLWHRVWNCCATNGSGFMASHDEFTAAVSRGARRLRNIPSAIAVHYDKHSKRIVIRLNTGLDIAFAPHDAQGLEDASPEQLDEIEISPSGSG